ncbi:protein FAM107B isoform X2 [Parasteatoda tepidariorum]|uniref:protein FAM107B isoform X2 n=1 Tax=Parasteatoda tepidariorum TaxID=114398 RepID=UPI001C71AAD3|nr:protein FAM107B isoform X2 [Parasteatoda tepidariorum]
MAVVHYTFGIPLISSSTRTKCELLTHGSLDQQKKKGSKKSGMIPEPDYGDSEESEKRNSRLCSNNGAVRFSEDGLVIPKKPQNPCMESSERQNLHRELLFNQKIGKSVIGQKTELHKAFDKFKEDQKKKELEEEKIQKKSALERKLEEQANKLKLQEELETKKMEVPDQPEFLRVHARVCAQTVDSKS